MVSDIVLIGELALHIFVPSADGVDRLTAEAQIQLGGGIGMIARQLSLCGTSFVALCLVGNDSVGSWLCARMTEIASKTFSVRDPMRPTSLVYLFYDETVGAIRILAGYPDPDLCRSQLDQLRPDSLVYCPFFPKHAPIAEHLVSCGHRVVFDFGHHSYVGDYDRIRQKITEAPIGLVAQINAGSLLKKEHLALLSLARRRGFKFGFATAGHRPAFGYDPAGIFSIRPTPNQNVCTVGAGDVAMAEILRELANSGDFRLGCQNGCASASVKCTQWGIASL